MTAMTIRSDWRLEAARHVRNLSCASTLLSQARDRDALCAALRANMAAWKGLCRFAEQSDLPRALVNDILEGACFVTRNRPGNGRIAPCDAQIEKMLALNCVLAERLDDVLAADSLRTVH